jgi:hypothetical protein
MDRHPRGYREDQEEICFLTSTDFEEGAHGFWADAARKVKGIDLTDVGVQSTSSRRIRLGEVDNRALNPHDFYECRIPLEVDDDENVGCRGRRSHDRALGLPCELSKLGVTLIAVAFTWLV